MDETTRDLIRQLCLRAGIIMEDASMLAVTMPVVDNGTLDPALARLDRDAQAVSRLIAAAMTLSERL